MSRRIQVFAHRGASAVAPESTLAAIQEAARAGAHGVELDIQMTQDGRLVVFHDDRLERTTDGAGRVSKTCYARLARLDVGAWFHPRFAGERMLLASQALRLVPRSMLINLELKRTPRRRPLIRRLLGVLRRAGVSRRLIVSSFDERLLGLLQDTRFARALICRERPERSLHRAVRLGCVAWHPQATLVTARRVAQAHAAGLRVNVWTVDRAAEAGRLVRLGVDGLFTNDPSKLVGHMP